jgi:signal transduction histidine kinase
MSDERRADEQPRAQAGDELQRTKRELARASAQLERLQRRRSGLLAMAAHDLRTPLAIIQGYSQLLESALPDGADPAAGEYITTIVAHTAVLRNSIENLVMLDQMERGDLSVTPVRCDLTELVGAALAQIEGLATVKELRVYPDVGENPVWVFVDEEQVGRILFNLFSHGEKYARPGGELWVEVRNDGDFGRVSVSDPARLLPDDRVARIFELVDFSQDNQASLKGADMGLVVTRQVAEAHGGRVEAHSAPGSGLVLTLYLPCCDGG